MPEQGIVYHERPKKLWNPSYIFMFCSYAFSSISFNMISPVLAKFAVSIGASLTIAGLLAGIFCVTSLVFRPISGAVSDRVNRKWLMAVTAAIIAVAMAGYAVSTNPTMLLVFRALHGIAFAINSTANMALASEFIPEERMGSGVGYFSMAFIIASAIAPSIGLWLIEQTSYMVCFLVSAGISTVTAIAFLFISYKPPVRPKTKMPRVRLHDLFAKELTVFVLLNCLFALSSGLVTTYISMLADERGIANIGLYFTVNAVVIVLTRPFAGRLMDKKGLSTILYPAYLLTAISMAMTGFGGTLMIMLAASVLKAIGQGSGQPCLQAECYRRLGKDRTGVAASSYLLGSDVGQGLGMIVGGAVTDAFGYAALFYGCTGLMLIGAGIFFVFSRVENARNSRTAETEVQ